MRSKGHTADVLAPFKPLGLKEGIKKLSHKFFMKEVVWVILLDEPSDALEQLSLNSLKEIH